MHASSNSLFYKAVVKSAVIMVLLSVCAFFLAQCGNAQQSSSLSLTSPDQPQVQWTSGPANASLGDLANIKIPNGYRFTGATGAKSLLKMMNNPIPKGLVGILAPDSGQWWVILEYRDIGYVTDSNQGKFNDGAILKAIYDRGQRQNEDRRMQGLPLITSVNWELPPVFDAKAHTLEWAIRAKTQTSEVINHAVRLLGRQGVLEATVVRPYESQVASDAVPLKAIMKDISFKPGERYADYRKGDKVSSISLAGLVAGKDNSLDSQKGVAVASAKTPGVWIWYVLAGVLAGGGVLLLGGIARRHRNARHRVSASARGEEMAGGVIHASEAIPAGRANGSESDYMKPKMAFAQNGSGNFRVPHRRRKIFDYYLFYVDTVMKMSPTGFMAPTPMPNSNSSTPSSHALGGQPLSNADANQLLAQAHLDLIANQKELIEQQKRLMVQQARLIEEKSKLLSEKSQLLDRQAELFERDVL